MDNELADRIVKDAWNRAKEQTVRAKRYRLRAFAAARSAKLYRKLWNMQLRSCEKQKERISELRAELNAVVDQREEAEMSAAYWRGQYEEALA